MNIALWRKNEPEPMTDELESGLIEELDRALLPAADRTKLAIEKAKAELRTEIETLDIEDTDATTQIIMAQEAISEQSARKDRLKAQKTNCTAQIAVLDRSMADIDALSNPKPVPVSRPSKSKKTLNTQAAQNG